MCQSFLERTWEIETKLKYEVIYLVPSGDTVMNSAMP